MNIRQVFLPILQVALCGLAACGGATRDLPRSGGPLPGAAAQNPKAVTAAPADALAEQRALLLLLEDRRLFEAGLLRGMLRGPLELREAVAMSLGRIGRLAAMPDLVGLLADSAAPVRRAAAFALGELNAKDAEAALLRAAGDFDREVGALAIEALGKLGVDVTRVWAAIDPLGEAEALARLLPFLFRFPQDGAVALGERGLASNDSELRTWAAYGLARNPRPAALPRLRELVKDVDPWVRGLAVRALGMVGNGTDLAALRGMLEDPAAGPVIHALRASRRLIREGKIAAPRDWLGRLLTLLDDSRPGVALTALEVSSAWLLDPELGDRLAKEAGSDGRRGELAMLALAEGGDARAATILAQRMRSENAVLRARAAESAALAGALEVLTALEQDPKPGVRAAVVAARLSGDSVARGGGPAAATAESLLEEARRALRDSDAIVRATALDWLAEHPLLPVEELSAAARRARTDAPPDALLAAVRALRARAAEAMEKGACLGELEQLAADKKYLVRREAGAALRLLDRPEPEAGAASDRPYEFYREIVERTRRARLVDLRLARGVIRLELDCPQAPQTCLSFLQLAAQGFFDGLTFHRVVPDFVVQGGDPRGDGSGGPGYELRDEINRLRFRRGALGMALSGPDTGGSQFFITLSAQPHLDGGYTIFGRVLEGMDLVDQIVQGERIERAVVLP
jgi:cyclophilin family peptidyl-prolyl cis-trans isomerase/HEAT repeat protein